MELEAAKNLVKGLELKWKHLLLVVPGSWGAM
jgi:hypothetical protein